MSSVGRVAAPGVIVLAAYQPDAELFIRQLRSLRDQTLREWTCIIAADSARAEIEQLVDAAVSGDTRFRVIGDGDGLGFYRNFERGLAAVPTDAEWVALSDQDDYWYPEKLATLVPMLADVDLVAGQVRLVEHPSGRVLGEARRFDSTPVGLVVNNEFTGSASAFRASLLEMALPFPAAPTRTAAHDHWLAVVAAYSGGTAMSPVILQDYVQHASNVFGDPREQARRSPLALLRTVREWSTRWEGSASPPAVLRMLFWLTVGWRQLLADTARERLAAARRDGILDRALGARRRFPVALRLVWSTWRAHVVPAAFVVTYAVSWFAGALVGGRRLVARERVDPRR